MRTPPLSDSELIQASWETPEIFAELFERHFRMIYRFLVVRVGQNDADDLAAEVFARAFAARRRYKPEITSARPWLYGIAANLARQRARSVRYHAQKLQLLNRRGDQITVDPIDEVVRRADAEAQWPQLAAALNHLSAAEREVVGLHLIAGLTQVETAQALGIPEGTVKSRLNRARHKLREHLTRAGETNRREGGGPSSGDRDG